MRRRCCCVAASTECDAPGPVALTDCEELACLTLMAFVLHLEFDDDENCEWSRLNGDYLFLPSPTPFHWYCVVPVDVIRQRLKDYDDSLDPRGGCEAELFYIDPINFPACVTSGFAWEAEAECLDDVITFGVLLGSTDVDCGQVSLQFLATIDLPFTLSNGFTLELTRNESFGPSVTITATATFVGAPCVEPGPCETGPMASFDAYQQEVEPPDNYADCAGTFSGGFSPHSCIFDITDTTIPGPCPIVGTFWSDGYSGSPRPPFRLPDSCGGHSFELTQYVLDSAGCLSQHSQLIECCRCCPPVGHATLAIDTHPDSDELECLPGMESDPRFPVTGGPCGGFAHVMCFYSLELEDPEVTDCGDQGGSLDPDERTKYWIEFNGLLDRDTLDPLPSDCYSSGQIIRFAHDGGELGFQSCLMIWPIDIFGCRGEPLVAAFPFAFSVIPPDPGPDPEDCAYAYKQDFDCVADLTV